MSNDDESIKTESSETIEEVHSSVSSNMCLCFQPSLGESVSLAYTV